MPNTDITNKGLGKIVSLEFIVLAMACAVAWGSLITNVSALDEDMKTVKVEVKADSDEIKDVSLKLAKIEINQEYFTKKFDEQSESQKEVLQLLRELSKGE